MHEDIEQRFGQLVASLSPEQYERLGPGLREDRLALAERGEALREFERVREGYERALEGCEWVKEDLERAQERTHNALRLLEDAL
jgi:hypothetical protein